MSYIIISKYSKHFDFVGCEVLCPSERVDAFSSGVNVTMTTSEIGVAGGVLMRVVCYVDIISITKGWPKAGVASDCILVVWVARVLGGRDVVRVGEGEDEAFCMVLVATGAVPWKSAVSTKEIAIAGLDNGDGGSFVVAALVEIS